MSCRICGAGTGMFGRSVGFTCPVCRAKVCQDCANTRVAYREEGGFFHDKHLQVTCPACQSIIKVR